MDKSKFRISFFKTKPKRPVSDLFRDSQLIIIFSTLLQTINLIKALLFELFLLFGITMKLIPSFIFYFNSLFPWCVGWWKRYWYPQTIALRIDFKFNRWNSRNKFCP